MSSEGTWYARKLSRFRQKRVSAMFLFVDQIKIISSQHNNNNNNNSIVIIIYSQTCLRFRYNYILYFSRNLRTNP